MCLILAFAAITQLRRLAEGCATSGNGAHTSQEQLLTYGVGIAVATAALIRLRLAWPSRVGVSLLLGVLATGATIFYGGLSGLRMRRLARERAVKVCVAPGGARL